MTVQWVCPACDLALYIPVTRDGDFKRDRCTCGRDLTIEDQGDIQLVAEWLWKTFEDERGQRDLEK